ncbi:MAG: ribosome-associated translation inhibitor RaiA [Chloroflexota bacterium]|nr:ribosome-associated translation inhibitor RaiA [Chloroflexota bacterium]
MQLLVHGRNVEVTDWIQEYVEKKVSKLERFLPQAGDARAELTHNSTRAAADRYTAQITIWSNGQILRAEESTSDLFASIDAVVDKLSSQVKRFKGRRYESRRRAAAASAEAEIVAPTPEEVELEAELAAEENPSIIIRRKQFVLQPMDEQAALEQMELLGHDFFVFFNPETDSANVLYRRKDGNYGLLQPSM